MQTTPDTLNRETVTPEIVVAAANEGKTANDSNRPILVVGSTPAALAGWMRWNDSDGDFDGAELWSRGELLLVIADMCGLPVDFDAPAPEITFERNETYGTWTAKLDELFAEVELDFVDGVAYLCMTYEAVGGDRLDGDEAECVDEAAALVWAVEATRAVIERVFA